MIRQLFDFVKPGGLVVIESATARRPRLRDEACVEIWHGIDKATMKRYHLSTNVTHLPSRRAIKAWMEMVGFIDVLTSSCHHKVTRRLGRNRAAFIAQRPEIDRAHGYYAIVGLNYDIGKAR